MLTDCGEELPFLDRFIGYVVVSNEYVAGGVNRYTHGSTKSGINRVRISLGCRTPFVYETAIVATFVMGKVNVAKTIDRNS